ncbi:hypothetical protein BDW22DRAFT_1360761 [Trametopsis cervina]|nr:hypothetical protein BDW22DRAFT_1360761 [Trametopsis cervina]
MVCPRKNTFHWPAVLYPSLLRMLQTARGIDSYVEVLHSAKKTGWGYGTMHPVQNHGQQTHTAADERTEAGRY